MVENLAEGLQKELKRNRELAGMFKSIGPNGMFGAAMIEQDIQAADKAITEGDVVAMLRAFNKLKENE